MFPGGRSGAAQAPLRKSGAFAWPRGATTPAGRTGTAGNISGGRSIATPAACRNAGAPRPSPLRYNNVGGRMARDISGGRSIATPAPISESGSLRPRPRGATTPAVEARTGRGDFRRLADRYVNYPFGKRGLRIWPSRRHNAGGRGGDVRGYFGRPVDRHAGSQFEKQEPPPRSPRRDSAGGQGGDGRGYFRRPVNRHSNFPLWESGSLRPCPRSATTPADGART